MHPDDAPSEGLPPHDRAAPLDHVTVGLDGELSAESVIDDGGVSGRGRLTVLQVRLARARPAGRHAAPVGAAGPPGAAARQLAGPA